MTIRYIRQRDLINCGPTAIINLLKFYGIRTSPAIRKTIRFFCKSNTKGKPGTNYKNLYDTLDIVRKMYFPKGSKVMIHNNPTLKVIDKALKLNIPVIFEYTWKDNTTLLGHYTLITSFNKGYYTTINNIKEETITFLSRKDLRDSLNFSYKTRRFGSYAEHRPSLYTIMTKKQINMYTKGN